MRNISIIIILLVIIQSVLGNIISPDDEVTCAVRTIYNDGNLALPDSVRIQVFRDGSELSDSWFNGSDPEVTVVDGWLVFSDRFQDIDGAGGTGNYLLLARAYDNDSALYTPYIYNYQVGFETDINGDILGSVTSVTNPVVSSDTLSNGDTLAVKKDSLVFQGDFSLFSSVIADTLKNRDSMVFSDGYWHKIAACSDSGNVSSTGGIYACNITVVDTACGQAINSVKVSVWNLEQSSLIGLGFTDSNGSALFNLFADSFLVSSFAPGYIFESYDTLVVTAGLSDSILGYQFDPGMPSFPDLCRVYGYIYDIKGQPESGVKVTASLPGGVARYDNSIISPYEISSGTDANGYFALDLIPSGLLLPQGQQYEMTLSRSDGTILRQRLEIPDSTNWQLSW